MRWFTRHISEARLASMAEERVAAGSRATDTSTTSATPVTADERTHLEGCASCRDLLAGHERALTLLTAQWAPRRLPDPMPAARRHMARPALARLAAGVGTFALLAMVGLAVVATSGPGGFGGLPPGPSSLPAVATARPGPFTVAEVDGRLAYSSGPRLGPLRIHVYDFDIATDRTVSRGPSDQSPSWSPDGKRIAYLGGPLVDGEPEGLTVSDADGSNAKRVHRGSVGWPAWSPDGEWIAFVGTHGDRGAQDLLLVRPHGTGLRQLSDTGLPTPEPDGVRAPDGFWGALGWSPDARSVATGVTIVDARAAQQYEIRAYHLDGRIETLVRGSSHMSDPAWSPDGKELVFTGEANGRPGDRGLQIRRADGRVERFATIPGIAAQPAWSPDGRYVAFSWNQPGSTDIGIIRVVDRAVSVVADMPPESFADGASWCRDC